ncbi:MAG: cation-translocating P-type ATPase [Firmicutes bacterium]|nr:cation-translocating P-type ATPase [Bacillota bacterium]
MTQTPCDLCGAPTDHGPQRQSFGGVERVFCCMGCLNVYAILWESGALAEGVDPKETEIFRRSRDMGLVGLSEGSQDASLPEDAETREVLYQVSGLWCASCGWVIEHMLSRERGVRSAEVLFTSDLLKVRYCPQYVAPENIPQRVAALGYKAEEYSGEREGSSKAWQDLLLRLGLAGAMWMNVMLFSLVIYASYWEHIAEWARRGVPFILMALATPAVIYSAWPIHRIAWLGLRQGYLRMEALISVGVFAAYGYSTVQAFMGGQHYYFDTACAIVTLMLTGKALERGAKERSAKAIAFLHRLLPRKARVLLEGREHFTSIEALQPGMLFLVKAGERIPADGVVLEGRSAVDESVVTGESAPVAKEVGSTLVCGSLNGSGVLHVRVTRAGEDSTLAQIVRAVEIALTNRSPLERTVDRVSRGFILFVLIASLLTLLGNLALHHSATEAMLRAIAVLVIACPCALGIATPLATTAAVGAASRKGILVRDMRVFEAFRKIDVLALDKTGTVTEGKVRVQEIQDVPLELAASLEAYSEHPLGQAVVRLAHEQGVALKPVQAVEVAEGRGLSGEVDGQRVVVGNARLMEERGIALPERWQRQAQAWQEEALTVAFVAVEGQLRGALAFGDRLRPDAADVVAALKRRGMKTVLISGDAKATTARIAAKLGVDEALGEVAPGLKAEVVAEFQKQGHRVAMVGDGINDAPALAAADLGIAMGGGADLARHAAPVVLLNPALRPIAETFDLAQKTRNVVRQNLFWAFLYNGVGITLAATGILNPILAAGAMVFSSLSVIGNSMRLNRG